MHQYSFEKLEVWQNARSFVKDIYRITMNFPGNEKFGITNQIRRASTSISANIAEGTSRKTPKDKLKFINISYSTGIEIKHYFNTGEILPKPTVADRLRAVKQHAEWSVEWKGERTGLLEMRQHYSNYFRGIPHFKDFKRKFLEVTTLQELESLIEETKQFYEELQSSVS